MYGIGKGFWTWIAPFMSPDGDSGGGGSVTELPEVPAPSSADLDELAGDDDADPGDGEDGDAGSEDDGDESDDDEPEDDATPPSDKKKGKKKDDDVVEEDDDTDEEEKAPKGKKDDDEEESPDEKKLPSLKAIKAKYPDFFKNFPQVRATIAEHSQFRSVFSSVDEAREATTDQEAFHQVRDALLDKADFGFLLDQLNTADSTATARLVKKILPAIQERSKDLYLDITEQPIAQFVHAAFARGNREGNSNLKNAALHMWRFLGKDGNPSHTEAGPSPADKEFERRMTEFETRKANDADAVVGRDIRTGLVGLIEQAIDPKNVLKGTTRTALVNELVRTIDTEIASDQNHMTRVNRLWANARRSSYAQGHLSRIISAYLERAKQVLPKHARKVREENNLVSDNNDRDERRVITQRDKGPAARPAAQGGPPRPRTIRETNPRQIDWSTTSDEDILSGRARLRR